MHKLRKKITNTVVILSHTREKLKYLEQQNKVQGDKNMDLESRLNGEKKQLA